MDYYSQTLKGFQSLACPTIREKTVDERSTAGYAVPLSPNHGKSTF
jgi:hypothetical protein